MRPVICSVDDTDGARTALRVARELSELLGATLVLVHVQPPTEAPGVSAVPAGQERLREQELADASSLLERLRKEEGLGDGVELRAEIGSAADRIVEICAELDAALVVLGSRGRGDVVSALLGSVSHSVASRASCPVVVVPSGASERSLH